MNRTTVQPVPPPPPFPPSADTLPPADGRQDPGHPTAPLAGRPAATAARRLRRALSHAPAVVLLIGEAGAGKSRLVQELRTPTADGPTGPRTPLLLTGHCPPPSPLPRPEHGGHAPAPAHAPAGADAPGGAGPPHGHGGGHAPTGPVTGSAGTPGSTGDQDAGSLDADSQDTGSQDTGHAARATAASESTAAAGHAGSASRRAWPYDTSAPTRPDGATTHRPADGPPLLPAPEPPPAADPPDAERSFPYGPFVAAVRDAAPRGPLPAVTAALRPLLPELADRLPPPLPSGPDVPPVVAHHQVLRGWHDLLDALGDVVIVIEDAQWADAGTRGLLEHLAAAPPPGLRILLTHRPEDGPHSRFPARLQARLAPGTARDEIALPPLDHDGLRELIAGWLGAEAATDGAAGRLHSRTLGNPAAATELLRQAAASRRGSDDPATTAARYSASGAPAAGQAAGTSLGTGRDPDTVPAVPAAPTDPTAPEDLPLPPVLRAQLLEQADRLAPAARRLADAAAVLERAAPEQLLLRVAGLGRASGEAGLAAAQDAAVLRRDPVDDRWRLTRPLLGEALRAALPLDHARALHRRAATELRHRDPAPYTRLAHHYRSAGLPDAWIDCAERAADQHLAAGEDATAAELLRAVLASHDVPPSRRAGLAVKLGRASGYGLAPRETLDVLRRSLEDTGLVRAERGELRLAYGLLLSNQAGRHVPSRRVLARAAVELSGPHPALASRAMSALAVPRATPHSAEVHLRWSRAATAAAERSGDPVTRTAVAVNRATLLVQLGDPQAWQVELPLPAAAGSATERGRQRELARGTLNLADGAVHLGHYGRAAEWLRRAAEQTATADTPYYRLGVGTTGLLLDWATGRWDQLAARTDRYAHSTEVAGLPMMTIEVRLVRALLALASSHPGDAERLLRDLHQPSAPGATAPVTAAIVGALARILLARGEAAAAWATVEPVVRIVQTKGIWVWAAELPPGFAALLATGDTAQTEELVDRFAAGLAGTDAPVAEAALLRCRALLAERHGRRARAAGLAADAEAAYRELPRPYEAAQAQEARARCARGDGTALLEDALERFTALGATWDASRCRQALRERGTAPRPVGRRGYGDRLSPREEETVRLAADGRTNREIAATLYMSARTAESHVANALRKLGLRSRRELPGYLAASAAEDAPALG